MQRFFFEMVSVEQIQYIFRKKTLTTVTALNDIGFFIELYNEKKLFKFNKIKSIEFDTEPIIFDR